MTPEKVIEKTIDELSVLWERMTDSRDGNIFVGDISTDSLDTAIDALKGNLPKFPYVLGQPAEIFFEGKWVRGKIVDGYRFRDGIVTIETDEGKRIWCGQSRTDLYREVNENDESRSNIRDRNRKR